MHPIRAVAGWLASSVLFGKARRLREENEKDWKYPLTPRQKAFVGIQMILADYAVGTFPPRFPDEAATFLGEIDYFDSITAKGGSGEEAMAQEMRKPFWSPSEAGHHLAAFAEIGAALAARGIHPPARLLELGCGSGWMAEMLALSGYDVMATSIDAGMEPCLDRRRRAVEAKGLPVRLEFRACAMEYVDRAAGELPSFDAAFVYEALHHAHDWRKALRSTHAVLAPGGWCVIANEPNLLHTLVSYRVGRLSNTHEIGMSGAAIKSCLRAIGFRRIETLKNRLHGWHRPIWIAAQK